MSNDKKVDVTISVDNHIHAGKPVAKGDRITVDEATAKWLTDNKLAARAGADAVATKGAK